jgi:hypothetical protein
MLARALRTLGRCVCSEGTVETFVSYFLNESNHEPSAWGAVANGLIGFHAYPTGSFSPDPTTFAGMFTYVDAFISEVVAVSALARVSARLAVCVFCRASSLVCSAPDVIYVRLVLPICLIVRLILFFYPAFAPALVESRASAWTMLFAARFCRALFLV